MSPRITKPMIGAGLVVVLSATIFAAVVPAPEGAARPLYRAIYAAAIGLLVLATEVLGTRPWIRSSRVPVALVGPLDVVAKMVVVYAALGLLVVIAVA